MEAQDSPETLVTPPTPKPAIADRVAAGARKLKAAYQQRRANKAAAEAERNAPIPSPSGNRGNVNVSVKGSTPDPEAAARNRGTEDPLVRRASAQRAEQDAEDRAEKREKEREDAIQSRRNLTTNPNDANERRTDDDRRKELRQRLKDKQASEEEARAAARGTTRRKIDYSIGIDPKTGERGIISKRQNRFTSYPGRVFRAKTQQASDSPVKAARALKRATIGSPLTAFRRGRDAAKAGRERIQFQHTEYQRIGSIIAEKSAAWTRKEGKNPSGGLNAKGVASYRAKNPGSKLKTAVTTKPSKLKKGSKAANRRKSFCARMSGMRKRQKARNNTYRS